MLLTISLDAVNALMPCRIDADIGPGHSTPRTQDNHQTLFLTVMAELKPVLPLVNDEITYLKLIEALMRKRSLVPQPLSSWISY